MIPAALALLVIIAGDGHISTAPVPDAQCADLASYAMFKQSVEEHAKVMAAAKRWQDKCDRPEIGTPNGVLNVWVCSGLPSARGADPSREFYGPDGDVRLLSEPKTAGCLP